MDNYADVLVKLALLGPAELDEVQKRVGFLRTIAPSAKRVSASAFERLVTDAIAAVLKNNGINWSLSQAKASGEYKKFSDKVATLEKFIVDVTKQRNEQRALLNIGFEILYRHLTQRVNIPVGGKVLMRQADRLPELLNSAFPGYARMGMLKAVVARREVDAGAHVQA